MVESQQSCAGYGKVGKFNYKNRFAENGSEQAQHITNHSRMVEVGQSQMFSVKIVVSILRHHPEKRQQQQAEKLEGEKNAEKRVLFVKVAKGIHFKIMRFTKKAGC